MLRPSDKHRIRQMLFGKIGIVVLLVLFILFGRGAWGVYQKARYAKENREQSEQELQKLQEREAILQKELERLDSPRGLEEEIRQKYDVGREGERLIVLVDAPEAEEAPDEEKKSVWRRIVEFFGF